MNTRTPTVHSVDRAIFAHTAKSTKALNVIRPTVQRGGVRL